MFFRDLTSVKIKPQTRTLDSVYTSRKFYGNDSEPFENDEEYINANIKVIHGD